MLQLLDDDKVCAVQTKSKKLGLGPLFYFIYLFIYIFIWRQYTQGLRGADFKSSYYRQR